MQGQNTKRRTREIPKQELDSTAMPQANQKRNPTS